MPSSIQICIKIGYSYRYGGATEIWRFLENILALFDAEDLATLCAVDLCSVSVLTVVLVGWGGFLL